MSLTAITVVFDTARTCAICKKIIPKNAWRIYMCYECIEYVECEECSEKQLCGNTLTLDIDDLHHVVKYDEISQEYALIVQNETVCPKNMNIVPQGYLDLTELFDKPLNSAYFEVTFLTFDSNEKVGIMLDPRHMSQAQLFGSEAFAYLNDGTVLTSWNVFFRTRSFNLNPLLGVLFVTL